MVLAGAAGRRDLGPLGGFRCSMYHTTFREPLHEASVSMIFWRPVKKGGTPTDSQGS